MKKGEKQVNQTQAASDGRAAKHFARWKDCTRIAPTRRPQCGGPFGGGGIDLSDGMD